MHDDIEYKEVTGKAGREYPVRLSLNFNSWRVFGFEISYAKQFMAANGFQQHRDFIIDSERERAKVTFYLKPEHQSAVSYLQLKWTNDKPRDDT